LTATGSIVKYAYDGLGRRIQKDVNGVKTNYVYDNEDIVAEYNTSNVLQATYLHGPGIDEPIRMTRGGQDYYYHADGLGSITELTNSTGAVVQTYEYDAFGNIVEQTPARRSFSEGGGALVNPFTYTGREFDSESGLFFYRNRYYDSSIGRFLQEDPSHQLHANGIPYLLPTFLKTPQKLNSYIYVGNNPINLLDPLGLDACSFAPDKPCGFDFVEACEGHDLCCACTGDRKMCADLFYDDILEECSKLKDPKERKKCADLAVIYSDFAFYCKKNKPYCSSKGGEAK